jgi:predicted NBD/HSP70 family sugar kinase
VQTFPKGDAYVVHDRPVPDQEEHVTELDYTTAALRRMTQANTLRVLREGEALTLAEIAARSGLSRPTVSSQVAELAELGWVDELPAVVRGGRPARTYRFNARAAFVLGVDIGASSIRVAIADLSGDVVAWAREGVASDMSGRQRVTVARRVMREVLGAAHVTPERVAAATLGTVGVVAPDGSITHSVLPGWSELDLAAELGQEVPCPIKVENDANVAALAELHRGAAVGASDVVYVLAGHRTGAALILDRRLRRGSHGAAGEIGALDVIGWAKGTADLAEYAGPNEGATELVFDAAEDGESAAQAAVARYAAALAQGIAALVLAVDPDTIVIGGGLSGAHERLIEPLRAELDRLCLTRPSLVLSSLGSHAVLLGAITAAVGQVNVELLGLDAAD